MLMPVTDELCVTEVRHSERLVCLLCHLQVKVSKSGKSLFAALSPFIGMS